LIPFVLSPIKPNQNNPVKWIDLTYARPEENLACDEALLDQCEEGLEGEVLRFWEPSNHFVVLGYSNRWKSEVDAPACAERRIPVLRRCSGGGTVLQGPGCLNYSLILKIEGDRTLGTITETNRHVLERNAAALGSLLPTRPLVQGHTDLTMGALKFSGNSQRRRRHFTLMHGTFLLRFDLDLIQKCLLMPSLQPDYRRGRPHGQFIMNLGLDPRDVKNALKNEWKATKTLSAGPDARVEALAKTVYATEAWNRKF
jgi:lipoate-protein ligase A